MITRCHRRVQHSRARSIWCCGTTLIEVLVAMVLLGTLLASALTARARYIGQATRAALKQSATIAADSLLTNWAQDWETQSMDESGVVPNEPRLSWQRHMIDRTDARDLGAIVLHLEIFETRPTNQPNASDTRPALATVEVLMPLITNRSNQTPLLPKPNDAHAQE